MTPEQAQQMCEPYSALYENVHRDLSRWKDKGISLELVQRTIKLHTPHSDAQKGFAAGFFKGKAYLVDKPHLASWMGHHVGLHHIYQQVLLDLERVFGEAIPDVELVINTIDRPLGLHTDPGVEYEPVFRFCKTNSTADILIPIFHFYMKNHTALLAQINSINRRHPWEKKKPKLFGRFSPYDRHMHPKDRTTTRKGADGKKICKRTDKTVACRVREHFVAWARKQRSDVLDIALRDRKPLLEHASYKYLLHLDGQGLSSRLDWLLIMNSVVFKEESGYYGFYHHLLRPYEHYVPFWRHNSTPADILDGLQWAADHDSEAQAMALSAQRLAAKYLTAEARACYWYTLLTEYAKLLTYKPGKTEGRALMQYYRPIQDFLDNDAKRFEGGRWLERWKFSP